MFAWLNNKLLIKAMKDGRPVYLNHIVGLRGIAILLVLIFHVAGKWCHCGQFGVDVFFVISGYFLWTGIQRSRAAGTFSLIEFYRKKVHRIIPLIVSLILVLFPVVLWFTTLSVRQSYGETSLAALFGLSNEYLEYFTGGYFDFGSANNPVRHTWYLSVMLQMYLLFPILIILFNHCAGVLRKTFWVLLFIVSFLAFHHQPAFTHHAPEVPSCLWDPLYRQLCRLFGTSWSYSFASPYYWTLGRVWELLAGALVPLLPELERKWHAPLALAGLGLIVLPAFTFAPGSLFVLPAVCGTMMVFRYGAEGMTGSLLNHKLLMGVGAISFSLYIWHWPVCVFWFELIRDCRDWISYLAILSISFLVSWLAWKFVETQRFSLKGIGVSWLAAFTLCAALAPSGGASWQALGIPRQIVIQGYHETRVCTDNPLLRDVPDTIHPIPNFYGGGLFKNSIWDNHDDALLLGIGNASAAPDFLMTGDSHANALFPAIDTFCKQANVSGVYLRTYIVPLPGIHWLPEGGRHFHVSPEKTEDFMQWMERHPEITKVILGQWWEARLETYIKERMAEGGSREMALREYESMVEEMCSRLVRAGKKVALINQAPIVRHGPPYGTDMLHYVNSKILREGRRDFPELSVSRQEYWEYSRPTREMFERLRAKGLCSILHQDTALFVNGVYNACQGRDLLIRDTHHLTFFGAMKSLEGMREELSRFLLPEQTPKPAAAVPAE